MSFVNQSFHKFLQDNYKSTNQKIHFSQLPMTHTAHFSFSLQIYAARQTYKQVKQTLALCLDS